MANASDYLEQQIYNHIFRNATFSKPTTLAIGLTPNVPNDAGYTEMANTGGYARIAGASGDAKWTVMTTPGSGENVGALSFPPATADWGYASGLIVTDSDTYNAGNLLYWGSLTTPRDIKNGDTFKFSAGDLKIGID